MTTLIFAGMLSLPAGADPFQGLDPTLVREIAGWKPGAHLPTRLLRFPHGRIDPPVCGLRAFGDAVSDYIFRINDAELLKALMFDASADDACVRAAIRQLLEIHGVRQVRAMMAERRKANPAAFSRPELATLTQLLVSPYARVKVARLGKNGAEKGVAERTLSGLKSQLVAGQPWDRAYRQAADQLLDKERSQKEGGWRTSLSYEYDGLIAPTGFDLLDYRISDRLKPDHIRRLFEAKGGVHLLETEDAYWLYAVEAFFE